MSEVLYERAEGVEFREVDEEAFLIHPGDQDMFNLNPIGAAIWRVMDEPVSPREVTELLCEAFPGQDRNRIARDVTGLFATLKKGGFIVSSE